MLPPPLAHHSWIPAPAGIPAGPCFRSPTPVSSQHRVGVLSHLCQIMSYVRTHLLLIPAREHSLVPRMSSWVAAAVRLSCLPHSPPPTCPSALPAPGFFSNLQPRSCLRAFALAPPPDWGALSSPFSRDAAFCQLQIGTY
ncbi:unnamed protein product [Rangifer tarandus platyrhynchus]|uniref:Uncharacterized protein n=1 Tax=Rangifer tarandus platyrhynchus TaxID=3082113 RepID=A0ABN8Z0E6_RANTA|nr:unnamed protein product [Rangifer tarandus platyrhynchus]